MRLDLCKICTEISTGQKSRAGCHVRDDTTHIVRFYTFVQKIAFTLMTIYLTCEKKTFKKGQKFERGLMVVLMACDQDILCNHAMHVQKDSVYLHDLDLILEV